jgi:hypothetical protein
VVAAQRDDDLIGIAYFAQGTTAGTYDLWYLSWQAGVVSPPEKVQTLFLVKGLAIAFNPVTREPTVAYLGGDDDFSITGVHLASWQNSDAVISVRNSGVWTEHIAVVDGSQAAIGSPNDDFGPVVGVYPALGYDSTGKLYFVYRDVHDGQSSGNQDYQKSDMELALGGPSSWQHLMVEPGGNDDGAWGGNPKMIMVGDTPALVSTEAIAAATDPGTDVWFTKDITGANAGNNWHAPIIKLIGVGDTYSNPALAYDSTVGYGMAVTEVASANRLTYQGSMDGSNGTWTYPADPIFENGSGGWYPTLAFEPATHYPHVAFYVCALTLGVTEGSCPANEDELRIGYRSPAKWNFQTVDPGGAFQPSLFFLANGKRMLVYRDIRSANLKVAVEQ